MKRVWIVGTWIDEKRGHWELQGVFSTEEKVVACCVSIYDCVAPFDLDREYPRDTAVMSGAYFPLAQNDHEVDE